MTIQQQIEAAEAAIATQEQIIRAPQELARLTDLRDRLEHRAERKAEIVEAIRVDPRWPAKVADARVAVEAAGAEVAAHERARYERLRSPKRAFNENRDRGKVLTDATAEAFEGTMAAGGTLPIGRGEGLKQALGMRFLPAPTLQHRIAQEKLDVARTYLRRLERWPHLHALDKLQAPTSGENAEDRIRNARAVPMGSSNRVPLRERIRRRVAGEE